MDDTEHLIARRLRDAARPTCGAAPSKSWARVLAQAAATRQRRLRRRRAALASLATVSVLLLTVLLVGRDGSDPIDVATSSFEVPSSTTLSTVTPSSSVPPAPIQPAQPPNGSAITSGGLALSVPGGWFGTTQRLSLRLEEGLESLAVATFPLEDLMPSLQCSIPVTALAEVSPAEALFVIQSAHPISAFPEGPLTMDQLWPSMVPESALLNCFSAPPDILLAVAGFRHLGQPYEVFVAVAPATPADRLAALRVLLMEFLSSTWP